MRFSLAALSIGCVLMVGMPFVHAADLVETASGSVTLKTFLSAVKAAGFDQTLKNTGPYTVFAPSDEAFAKLPAGTVDRLLQDREKLARALAHLIVPGKLVVTEIKPGKMKTLQGDLLSMTSDNGLVTVDGASIIQSDIVADNGVIHEIDTFVID